MFTDTVTIFNVINDAIVSSTVFSNTFFKDVIGSDYGLSGESQKNSVKVRILISSLPKPYVEPLAFAALEDKSSAFTIQEGDFLLKGVIDEPNTATLNYLSGKYDKVFKISSVVFNDKGTSATNHILVRGA